jgi:hypothetical protein
MRVIITARQSLTPVHGAILSRLVNILGEISKNPSNPKFNQYCFESVSALIRFVCDGTPGALSSFEQAIFGPAQIILANDVTGKLNQTTTEKELTHQNLSHTSSKSWHSCLSCIQPTTYPKSTKHCFSLFFPPHYGSKGEISRP